MADQTRSSTLTELHRAIEHKERELFELDLMLADYHTEHSRLTRELGWLRAQLRNAENAASSITEPLSG